MNAETSKKTELPSLENIISKSTPGSISTLGAAFKLRFKTTNRLSRDRRLLLDLFLLELLSLLLERLLLSLDRDLDRSIFARSLASLAATKFNQIHNLISVYKNSNWTLSESTTFAFFVFFRFERFRNQFLSFFDAQHRVVHGLGISRVFLRRRRLHYDDVRWTYPRISSRLRFI